jgi:rhodanese-related sulfurtransferase
MARSEGAPVPGIIRVSPEEARGLLEEGYQYVDVRTEAEYASGHVPGALNVPSMLRGPGGLEPNPEFTTVMEQAFDKDARLMVGCQTGKRSIKAAELLEAAGFSQIRELRTGFGGSRDAFGRAEPGWAQSGFPVESGPSEGRTYADAKLRRR